MNFLIDLSKARDTPNTHNEEINATFQNITIQFILPNESVKNVVCSIGETVDMIRERLNAQELCSLTSKFYYEDVYMMDPLSLNDFPLIMQRVNEGKEIIIKVK
jgi:hypothetical protein